MEFRIGEMQKEKETLRLNAKRRISEKQVRMLNEISQLINLRDTIIPYYQKNYDASLLAYKQNTLSLFVLLDAWEKLLMNKMEYLDKNLLVLSIEAELEYEKEIK